MSAKKNNPFAWVQRMLRRPDHPTPSTDRRSLLTRFLGLVALRAAADWGRDLLRDWSRYL